MKASGVEVPMGAIMTYGKIALVSLDDCHQRFKATEILSCTGKRSSQTPMSQKEKACTERTSSDESPVKEGRNVAYINVEHKKAMTATSSGNDGDSDEKLEKYEQLDWDSVQKSMKKGMSSHAYYKRSMLHSVMQRNFRPRSVSR